uniref:TRAF-type domain-containing protein n=1 Tax=Cuerna arida TaxID=1464854 RepID=A0A1B6GRF7_9HEMI
MSKFEELEERLYDILQCTICLNLPKDTVYQCTNGHLMCPGCLTRLLTELKLEKEDVTCLHCHCIISQRNVCRNVIAELVAAELPASCRLCNTQMSRKDLEQHELELCSERVTECPYKAIGCRWRGPHRESGAHGMRCPLSNKSGADILKTLVECDHQYQKKMEQFDSIFNLLSTQKIVHQDIEFGFYKTSKVGGLSDIDFFDTISFPAFKNEWRLEARLIRHPLQPKLMYQLILDSSEKFPCILKYLLLQGPHGYFKIQPRIVNFHFSDTSDIGPEVEVTLSDPSLYTILVSGQYLKFRLIMFLLTKEENTDD